MLLVMPGNHCADRRIRRLRGITNSIIYAEQYIYIFIKLKVRHHQAHIMP